MFLCCDFLVTTDFSLVIKLHSVCLRPVCDLYNIMCTSVDEGFDNQAKLNLNVLLNIKKKSHFYKTHYDSFDLLYFDWSTSELAKVHTVFRLLK